MKSKGHKTNTVRDHSFAKYVNPDLAKALSQLAMDKVFARGEGCYLFDVCGARYLDFLSQYGALPFGFNHPYIWDAVNRVRETAEPSFVQPSYLNAASELAKRLVEIAPPGMRYVAFANSGAEAVEAAIKLCKAATGRDEILAANNSFHGKTLGALSATDKKKYQERFGAPVPGYRYVTGRKSIRAFGRQTCDSERGHMLMLFAALPATAYALSTSRFKFALYFLMVNIVLNVYPILLQRYTRARIVRILGAREGGNLR